LASIDPVRLRESGFGYRADTITKAARYIVDQIGAEGVRDLQKRSYDEAIAELIQIPYVGRKLADCTALFGLHHLQAVPIDTHIWQAAVRHYFPELAGQSLTDARYRRIGDFLRTRFGSLAGWAQQYLFYENLTLWRVRRKATSDREEAEDRSG
jgi:N-glycosylase/DNA lyase